jgi:hypothetical protein
MDPVERGAEIERARAERVVRPAAHEMRQVGPALQHFLRRPPVRPFALHRDEFDAGPGESRAAHPDAVAQRLAARLDQIEALTIQISAALTMIVVIYRI